MTGALPPRRHPHYTGWPDVEGYCWPHSHEPGDRVAVRCSASANPFSVEVARVGAQRVVVWQRTGIRAADHHSETLTDGDEAWSEGCDWPVTFVVPTEPEWPSGFYHVRMVAGAGADSDTFFVLRPKPRTRPNPLLVLATNTWNAYNQWGGRCLYSGADRVSFARPLERGYLHRPATDDADLPPGFDGRVANTDGDPEHRALQRYQARGRWPLWTGSAGWHNWERRFVAWAEGNGFDIDVAVNADLEFHPDVLDGANGLLSVGHDEYWSSAMRDTVDNWVDDGGRWAVFSGNTCFWRVRFDDVGQTMICHRDTDLWSDPRTLRPENSTTGLSFTRGGYHRMGLAVADGTGTYTIHRPDHWALAGTGLAEGDRFGENRFIVAYEVDGCDLRFVDGRPIPTGVDGTPPDLDIVATAPARLTSITDDRCEAPQALWANVDPPGDLEATAMVLFGDDRPENVARIAHGHAVMGSFRRGAGSVFNAGTTDWAYGLEEPAECVSEPATPSEPIPPTDQITLNVLRHVTRFQER